MPETTTRKLLRLVRRSLWWQVPSWLVLAAVAGATADDHGLERAGEVLAVGFALLPTMATPWSLPLAERARMFGLSLLWLFAALILYVLVIAAFA